MVTEHKQLMMADCNQRVQVENKRGINVPSASSHAGINLAND